MTDEKVGIPIKCQINKRNSTDDSFSRRTGTAFVNANATGWNYGFWEHPQRVDPVNGQVAPVNCQTYTVDVLADNASYTMLESKMSKMDKFKAKWQLRSLRSTIIDQSDPQPQQTDLFDQGVQNEVA